MLYIKNTNENGIFYATLDAAGFDIASAEDCVIEPGEWRAVASGLFLDVEMNNMNHRLFELQIRPRSGLAFKHGVTVLNAPGTVDRSYPDEIKVILINHGKVPFVINKADRIAQGVVNEVSTAANVGRRDVQRTGGLGSTGK